MDRTVCRLCFVCVPAPIGIFSGEGMANNIVDLIRLHLADEISEEDPLPKVLCRVCWTKVLDFHEFYKTVKETKHNFLVKYVKIEEPETIVVNCDPVVRFDTIYDKVETPTHDADDSTQSELGESDILCGPLDADWTDNTTTEFDHLIAKHMNMFCEMCEYSFESLTDASRHYRNKHKTRSVKLNCCPRRVIIPGEIREHIQYHLNPDKFKCELCNRTYKSGFSLRDHRRHHIAIQSRPRLECDHCDKRFTSKKNILSHILSVHVNTEKKFKCKFCEKSFITKSNLTSHVQQVHERRYQQMCHICARVFNSKQTMLNHMKEHSDVKEPGVSCELCGKLFKDKFRLRKHIKRMHGQNDGVIHECPECQKQFGKKESLKAHISYVHDFKVHKCEVCGKECKKTSDLKEHMAIHSGVDLYKCDFCPRTFKAKSNRHTHCKRMHPEVMLAAREAKKNEQMY